MATLADEEFSTAIFGPAWTHEHFSASASIDAHYGSSISIAKAVDRSIWEGFSLPDQLDCDCRKGRPHHSKDYILNPIIKSAREYPAGSASFLETSFSPAFSVEVNKGSAVCPRFLSSKTPTFLMFCLNCMYS